MWIIWVHAAIGALVVGYFLLALVRETIRAARQSHRIATVQSRLQQKGRKPPLRWWWGAFRMDFMNGYTAKRIGPYELNWNPNIPAKKSW